MSDARIVVADWLWDGAWRADGALLVGDGFVRPATPAEAAGAVPVERIAGSVMPPLTDFHVHLDLVDAAAIAAGGLARVLDLGSHPDRARRRAVPNQGDPGPEVVVAGQILTAVGGYPGDRTWAADGMFLELGHAREADAAVNAQVAIGARVIKIALNRDAGPVWPDDLLAEVVGRVHAAGLPVVAHVEGAGEAARAATAGVDAFAHAPFSEHLDDALLTHLAATTTWISTLRIHTGRDRGVALANTTRFHAAGGCILYGTDMGNGPASGGLERDELEALGGAGLSDDAILESLTGGVQMPRWAASASLNPAPPATGDPVEWLLHAEPYSPQV